MDQLHASPQGPDPTARLRPQHERARELAGRPRLDPQSPIAPVSTAGTSQRMVARQEQARGLRSHVQAELATGETEGGSDGLQRRLGQQVGP
jgi:hypothetical protein